MTGVAIPKKGKRISTKSTKRRESKKIRYAFYLITILLIITIIVSALLYNSGLILQPLLNADSSMALSLLFTALVFSYLLYRGKSIKQIISGLGLSKDKLTVKFIAIGIILFFAIMLFNLALTIFSAVTNIPLPTNVQTLLAGTPLYFLIFTFLIAPINEEILFRGFLVPRTGIIISALIFAVPHLSYISISEFAAAFVFGLLAGYVFKKTQSLYSSILAHILVNFLTIISLIYFGMLIHI